MAKETLFPVNEVRDVADLPVGFLKFFERFARPSILDWAHELKKARVDALARAHQGRLPTYTGFERALAENSSWKVALPDWCQDQRNQMTGPADDAELVVKMLNSGAPGVMIDFEDSEVNTWPHLKSGMANAISALHGELTYQKAGKTIGIKESKTVTWVRVRGLHMTQVLCGKVYPAPLFDLALLAYQLDASRLKHPLCIYIPKSESGAEGIWWNRIFDEVALAKGWPVDYIKCMALVESHPMAYEMESFIRNLKDHILGLNLGRWDYMASLIHFNLHDPNWVLPDRNTIPHDVPFFQRLRELLVHVCHKRGILAIGGMTALYPSRNDPELNGRALAVLAKDKRNESEIGMDGAWTGHPDQNEIAVAQFPEPNQLYRVETKERFPDLRPKPEGIGAVTLEGTRAAIRTCIRYRYGVLSGKGASLLSGYMEDLATDRIYRLMLSQRIKHHVGVEVNPGVTIFHTPRLVTAFFDQELEKILEALPDDTSFDDIDAYLEARRISEEMITRGEFDPS